MNRWCGLAAALCGACDALPPCEDDAFVAMQTDFEHYERWRRFPIDEADPRLGSGARSVYVNALPPRGSRVFPQCTILVKVAENGPDPSDRLVLAMAKRGADYNPDGAVGWEWFELSTSASGTPLVEWRGPEPPEGRGYVPSLGGDDEEGDVKVGDCNFCHGTAADNDFVLTPDLELRARGGGAPRGRQ